MPAQNFLRSGIDLADRIHFDAGALEGEVKSTYARKKADSFHDCTCRKSVRGILIFMPLASARIAKVEKAQVSGDK